MKNTLCSKMMSRSKGFIKKYFLEGKTITPSSYPNVLTTIFSGQKLEAKQVTALETLPEDAPFLTKLLVRHRRIVGILIPLIFFETLWWAQV